MVKMNMPKVSFEGNVFNSTKSIVETCSTGESLRTLNQVQLYKWAGTEGRGKHTKDKYVKFKKEYLYTPISFVERTCHRKVCRKADDYTYYKVEHKLRGWVKVFSSRDRGNNRELFIKEYRVRSCN